jgi:hypothetical protein
MTDHQSYRKMAGRESYRKDAGRQPMRKGAIVAELLGKMVDGPWTTSLCDPQILSHLISAVVLAYVGTPVLS